MAETKEQAQKGVLKKYLDNTFGDEGLKTDVKITLTNETIFKFVAAVVGATTLSAVAYYMIKEIMVRRV